MNLSLRSVRCAIALGAVALGAQGASAAVSCTYDGPSHWFTVLLGSPGDYARIAANADATLAVGGVPCGAATVTNTDGIAVYDLSNGSTKVELDGSQSNFAPGFKTRGSDRRSRSGSIWGSRGTTRSSSTVTSRARRSWPARRASFDAVMMRLG